MKNIYVIGAGGFGREVLWAIERINKVSPEWNVKGIIDDNELLLNTKHDGYPVVGGCDYLRTVSEEVWVVCAIGSAKVKRKIIEKLSSITNLKFATIVDPSVIMSDRVQVGEGSIICAGTIITVDIKIGQHVIFNLDCTVGHDAVIDDYVTVYPSVNISGNVHVGEETELGTGCQVIQGKNIGKQSIIGAGAVVVKDIPEKCTAVGSPAKPIKYMK